MKKLGVHWSVLWDDLVESSNWQQPYFALIYCVRGLLCFAWQISMRYLLVASTVAANCALKSRWWWMSDFFFSLSLKNESKKNVYETSLYPFLNFTFPNLGNIETIFFLFALGIDEDENVSRIDKKLSDWSQDIPFCHNYSQKYLDQAHCCNYGGFLVQKTILCGHLTNSATSSVFPLLKKTPRDKEHSGCRDGFHHTMSSNFFCLVKHRSNIQGAELSQSWMSVWLPSQGVRF